MSIHKPVISPEVVATMDAPSGPALDQVTLLEQWPGEGLLAANLDALRSRDPPLADKIAGVVIDQTCELVLANDGSPTFRLCQPNGRRIWLGYSSVPLIAARANLARMNIGVGNMAMNGIGSGADAQNILQRLGPHQALLVTESDPLKLNLVFRLRNLSEPLRTGRLVLLLGEDPRKLLEDFFVAHPGYNIVDKTVSWAWLTDKENQLFAQQAALAVEQSAPQTAKAIGELLDRRQKHDRKTSPAEVLKHFLPEHFASLRATNCTNSNAVLDYCTSRDALAGLASWQVTTDWLVLDRPDCVSAYAQLSRLEKFNPHLILLVDVLRADVSPAPPASALCVSLLREPATHLLEPQTPPTERMGPNDFIFTSRHDQLEKLQLAGYPTDRFAYLPLAANTDLFQPVELADMDQRRYGADIVVVADRASSDPEDYQIKLPTHQQLWQSVIDEIQRSPAQYQRAAARKYLLRAQRCGIELRGDDLRQHFTELIENFLGDTVLLDTYCSALEKEDFNLRLWAWSGLRQLNEDDLLRSYRQSPVSHHFAGAIANGPELNKLYNAAKIHLHLSSTGYVTRHVLDGIAAGAFFLIKAHPRDHQTDGIGKLFDLDRELITFETPKDLSRKVRYFLDHAKERRQIASAARKKLLARHTYQQRMREMLDIITAGTGFSPH